MVVYVAISIAVVNVLALVVLARLGRRLSGTMDQPRRHRAEVQASPAPLYQLTASSAPPRIDDERNQSPPRGHERALAPSSASLAREL